MRVPAGHPLTFKELVTELKSGRTADATLRTLRRRGLAFEPELEDIAALFQAAGVTPDKLPGVKDYLDSLVAPEISLEAAKPLIVSMLDRIAANPNDANVLNLLHPALAQERGQVAAAFADYQKHSIGLVRPIEHSRRTAVPLYIFTKGGIERLEFAVFTPSRNGKLLLRNVLATTSDIASIYLASELQQAAELLRNVYRDISQGDRTQRVGVRVGTAALNSSLELVGGWQRLARSLNATSSDIVFSPNATLQQNGIRIAVRVSQALRKGRLDYVAEFERFGDDVRVVRLRDSDGRDIAADPEVNCYLYHRYGIETCQVYQMVPSQQIHFLSVAELTGRGDRYLKDFRGPELREVAEELDTISPSGDNPAGLSMLASALFLEQRFDEAEQKAQMALDRNAEVWFPVLHYFTGGVFKRVTVGLSKEGLDYEPSPEAPDYPKMRIPWDSVARVTIEPGIGLRGMGTKAPLLQLNVTIPNRRGNGRAETPRWNIGVYPTGCNTIGAPLPSGMHVYTAGNACGSNVSVWVNQRGSAYRAPFQFQQGGNSQFGTRLPGATPQTVMVVPPNWRAGLLTMQRLILRLKGSA